jgi:hypothetical protein
MDTADSPGHIILLLFILTANGFLPGGSHTTITHFTQNNTTIKRNTAHKSTHTIHKKKTAKYGYSHYEVFLSPFIILQYFSQHIFYQSPPFSPSFASVSSKSRWDHQRRSANVNKYTHDRDTHPNKGTYGLPTRKCTSLCAQRDDIQTEKISDADVA